MIVEYKNIKNMSADDFISALFKHRHKNNTCTGLMVEDDNGHMPIALIHMDLYWACHFLVSTLADLGVNMDAHLSNLLQETEASFASSIMKEFIRFRSAMGLELSEDLSFFETEDLRLYTKGVCMCPPEYANSLTKKHDTSHLN